MYVLFKYPKLKLLETSIFRFSFSFFPLFPMLKKLNISLIYKAIVVIFSVDLTMINLYKFCKKEILIQPPGEPREQHLGDVRSKVFRLIKVRISNWLLNSKISLLETLKLLEVLVCIYI